MDIIKIIKEMVKNEHEKYKAFKDKLIAHCTNKENAVYGLLRVLRGMERDLGDCLNGAVKVYVDRSIIIKVLKTVRVELDIVRHRMKHPDFNSETIKNLEPLGEWTDEKLNLIELIYAVCKTKSINHGDITMKEVQECVEYIFQIKLGNISNRIEEMEIRKEHDQLYLEILLNNLKRFLDDKNA
jgi:hypothetical protein